MAKSAQEALEKINATQKSIADKAEEITKSVEDAKDKEEKAEKSEQPEQKECDDKEAKKSEAEDKKDDKDKEEKSESKESTGKLEHEKAPEKDPAAKSLEADITSGNVEAHELEFANVANTGVDYLEAVNKSLDLVNTMFGAYQELAKSVTADKEVEKSVEKSQKDMDDPDDDDIEESAKSKKSEAEDKKDDKDKEEKSESKESTGKLEHEKAPEKDPAAKSEDKGEVEKSMVSVKPLGEDKTEKSITNDSGISKEDFIDVVSKSINNYEDANNVINYSDSISLLKSLKEKASEADYISNDMVEEYEKA